MYVQCIITIYCKLTTISSNFRRKSAQVKVISLADLHKSKMSNYEESDLQWLCLKANLILDQPLAFTEEKTNCPLKEKLDAAVKKMEVALDKGQ